MKKKKIYLIILITVLSIISFTVMYKYSNLPNSYITDNKNQYDLLAVITCSCSKCRTVAAECATCYPEVCAGGYEDKNCDPCYYGSPSTCSYGCDSVYTPCKTGSNTCVGGNVDTTECETLGAAEYQSGAGGKNYSSSEMQNITSSQGTNSGNGLFTMKFIRSN